MPLFRPPRTVGRHRIAAIALYRALQSQAAAAAPLAAQPRSELQNLIRNRFRQFQHVQSVRRLKLAFEAGYEALDLLDSLTTTTNKNSPDQAQAQAQNQASILSLLALAPDRAKHPLPALPPSAHRKPPIPSHSHSHSSQPKKKPPSILSRPVPLPDTNSKRHVPALFSANGIPVLRIKKPQPPSLSGYLRQRIRRRQRWHDLRQRLGGEAALAGWEDEWDRMNGSSAGGREPGWRAVVDGAVRETERRLWVDGQRDRWMGERMQEVVDREQEVYDLEKREGRRVGRSGRRRGAKGLATAD